MDIDPIFSDTVKNRSEIPPERLRVVQTQEGLRLSHIRSGIVFVYAIWSGSSVMGFKKLTRLLSTVDTTSLDIVVLDNDCMNPDDMIRLFGHVFHGAGETLWLRDGQVVAELQAFRPESDDLILSHTKALL
jgi:hypothetical protein